MSREKCFIEQTATMNILLKVTNVCSECYGDFINGSTIFYDLKACRYICELCHERLLPLMSSECVVDNDDLGLF
jgi:hypothetical protein